MPPHGHGHNRYSDITLNVDHLQDIDPNLTDGHNDMLFGTDNPDTGYTTLVDSSAGVILADKAIFRQGNDIPANFIDNHGVVQVDVPSGYQVVDPANGVFQANANRFAWNENPVVESGPDAINKMMIDLDPTSHIKALNLIEGFDAAINPNGDHGYWAAADSAVIPKGTVVINDDMHGENSFNWAFVKQLIDADPHTPGIQPYNGEAGAIFDFSLSSQQTETISRHGHDQVRLVGHADELHMQFHVV